MNATAVERVTPPTTGPSGNVRRIFPPSIRFLLRWGLFTVVGMGVVVSVALSLVQKWLWMRQLNYSAVFWTLLSVKWGLFGVALVVSIFYLWLNLRFAARNIDLVSGESVSFSAWRNFDDPGECLAGLAMIPVLDRSR